jgi:hypothetical protein
MGRVSARAGGSKQLPSLPSASPDDPRIGSCGCTGRLPMRRDGRRAEHHRCSCGDGPREIVPSTRRDNQMADVIVADDSRRAYAAGRGHKLASDSDLSLMPAEEQKRCGKLVFAAASATNRHPRKKGPPESGLSLGRKRPRRACDDPSSHAQDTLPCVNIQWAKSPTRLITAVNCVGVSLLHQALVDIPLKCTLLHGRCRRCTRVGR